MTLLGWIGYAVISMLVVGLTALVADGFTDTMYSPAKSEYVKVIKKKPIAFVVLILASLLVIMIFYYNGTESGKRAFHTQESNFNGGLERKVTVYDAIGNVLYEYEGKIDVEYENGKVLFDDENGKRHVIYYNTGTAIVEEKEE